VIRQTADQYRIGEASLLSGVEKEKEQRFQEPVRPPEDDDLETPAGEVSHQKRPQARKLSSSGAGASWLDTKRKSLKEGAFRSGQKKK